MRICGIDEAGRGPVIGPLVIACVCVSDEESLRRIGVKDSKKLKRKKREELAKVIERIGVVEKIVLEASEIDQLMDVLNLNQIEAGVFAKLIEKLKPDIVYVDAAENNAVHFKEMIEQRCAWKCQIVAEHRADEKYPVVSAASIIAKVYRDEAIEKIKKDVGVDFGSGYPSDPRTIKYLQKLVSQGGELPIFVRRHWSTVERVKNKKLEEFE